MGMQEVWQAAIAAFPDRAPGTVDILICSGWNCDGGLVPLGAFAAKKLVLTQTWGLCAGSLDPGVAGEKKRGKTV